MRRPFRLLASRWLLLAALPFTSLTARPASAVVAQITSIPSANQSWGRVGSGSSIEADVFWIRNSVFVSSTFTLTMRPGIIVKFDPGTFMQVNGALQAVGNGANPILITSSRDDTEGGDTNGDGAATSPAPSDWNGIYLQSHTSPDSSRFGFCDIAYGGYGGNGMLTFATGVSGDVVNCTLRRSYVGVAAQGTGSPLLVDTSIQNSSLTPIEIDVNSNPVFNRLTFSSLNNGYDAIGIRSNTLVSGSATLPKRAATVGTTFYPNVSYVMFGGVIINPGATLTLSPGVVVKMTGGSAITNYGTLTMNGTVTDTISVTSINDDNLGQPLDTNDNGSITSPHPSDWGNISFQPASTGSIQYCRIKFGTTSLSSGMVESFNVALPISNTLLSDAGHGYTFHGFAGPTLTNVVINNMTSCPTLMSLFSTPTFTNLSFNANAITALGINSDVLSGAQHLSARNVAGFTNITYYVMNGFLDVGSGASLTIDPGITMKFQNSGGVGMVVDGSLVANGTVSAPIVFTSERDNTWGNPSDTNGDGSATSGAPGQWGYIRFTSTSTASTMNYCRIECGSAAPFDGYPCNLWISSSSPTVSHCNINRGAYGIRTDGAATPSLGTADTVVNCLNAPMAMSVQSDPTFTQPFFNANGTNGLQLISETLVQNSTIKYRPQITFQPPALPAVYAYVVNGQITVPTGVTLAIQPQVVIKVNGGSAFSIAGTLNAVGNPGGSNRIVFTSYRDDATAGDTNADISATSPAAGDWSTAFSFAPTATPNSVVRNCLFTFGGGGGPVSPAVMATASSPRIVGSDFLFNLSALTFGAGSKSVVDSCSILNCSNLPVSMSLLADPTFLHITWSGNPYSVIGILGETVSQDAHLANRTLGPGLLTNIAYAPTGTIHIASGANWTINPGITIKLGRYGTDPIGIAISIDGGLIASGKPDSLIVFTSIADDAFGGDNNGDGASSHGNPADWEGIGFSALTNAAATVMNYCRVRYAGLFAVPAISMTNTGFPISNTDVTAGYEGIDFLGTSAPTLTTVNVDSCTYFPVRMSLVANPGFSGVNFRLNSYTGIGVVNETIAQDVLWKIRPISGRSNMPYLLDGTLGVGLGTTMTLQPGLIVKFRSGSGITINRAFLALGGSLPESLIVMTSTRDDFYGGRSDSTSAQNPPTASSWNYVLVQSTAITGQVKFRNCVFRYGGQGTLGALRCFSSSPTVDSCQFAYNSTGISVEGSANPVIHGSSFLGHTTDAVYNNGTSFCVDATGCWWGANDGPNDPSAAPDVCNPTVGPSNLGSGDPVTNNVNYAGFSTTGILNPLVGDVSLNGRVLAYDASLVYQYLVALVSLSPLQKLVADVTGNGTITGLDGSDILQWVAGVIGAFPAEFNHAGRSRPGALEAQRRLTAAGGTFHLSLGEPRPAGAEWLVPVIAEGSAPIYAAELRLGGPGAAALAGFDPADGGRVLEAHNVVDGDARVAMGAAEPLTSGTIGTLRFAAGADWKAPQLAWARVNETETTAPAPAPPAAPAFSALEAPSPNPAQHGAGILLAIAAAEAGRSASVEVLDVSGRRVRSLAQGVLAAGLHPLRWDLTDSRGAPVPAGIYLVRARVGSFAAVRRLAVVR